MDVGGSNRLDNGGFQPSRPKSRAGSARTKPARKATRAKSDTADHLAFTFPSSSEQGHDVQQRILASAEQHGFHGESFFALRIALEEALVNAIKHGNRMDPQKVVRVQANVTPQRVEIFVEDEGPGFDRASVPDPTADENLHRCSGRGILLIESYMSEVKWDHGGRRLHMVRENRM